MTRTQGRRSTSGGPRRARRAAILTVVASCLLALLPTQPAASGAELFGRDISALHCGAHGLAMPPTSTSFVTIDVTNGRANSENPCLGTQVAWATDNAIPAHAVTYASFPTDEQLEAADEGPYDADTAQGRLANAGYVQGRFALQSLTDVAWEPSVVWVALRHDMLQPWPAASTADRAANRLVVQGLTRALRDAGVGVGYRSETAVWQSVTGGWQTPGVPAWVTSTLEDRDEALDRCTEASFSGGRPYLSGWPEGLTSHSRTCGDYALTDLPRNLAGAAEDVLVASADAGVGALAGSAVDGVVGGYPDGGSMEWASDQHRAGAAIELSWADPVTLDQIVLHDRPNLADQVTSGVLRFSDGSQVAVGALPNDGAALAVTFTRRAVTSVTFDVLSVSTTTWSAGLAEIEAWGRPGGTELSPVTGNVARLGARASASSADAASGQTAAKAIDGTADGYPGDYRAEWATTGGLAGSWLQLDWARPVTLDRVVLRDRPNAADQITAGILTFADGSTVAVPALPNDGGYQTITFPARLTESVRLTVTATSATTGNAGLAEFEAWGHSAVAEADLTAAGVSVTASGEDAASRQTAVKAIDGVADGYPGDSAREWVAPGGKAGSWLQLTWAAPVMVGVVVVHDRVNANDQIASATLTFSDGSTVDVSELPDDGSLQVGFLRRPTTSLRLTVTSVSGSTENVGLAELEVLGTPSGVLSDANVARYATTVTASGEDMATGQTASKALDGRPDGFPGDHALEWVAPGAGAGSWIELGWATPATVDRVVLYDRPNASDHVTGATLRFSDGSTVPVPALSNDGAPTTVTFPARTIDSMRLEVTDVSATTGNAGLAELEAWGY